MYACYAPHDNRNGENPVYKNEGGKRCDEKGNGQKVDVEGISRDQDLLNNVQGRKAHSEFIESLCFLPFCTSSKLTSFPTTHNT